METMQLHVSTEVARLRRVMIHSPNSGLGKIVPSKAQEWLFEDIVHVPSMLANEYDYFVKLLLYFLDTERVKGRLAHIDDPAQERNFYKPGKAGFHASDKVVELQRLLAEVLAQRDVRLQLTAAICAVEGISNKMKDNLMALNDIELAATFITGSLPDKTMIFHPLANLIFTRDIGIVINDHLLLNKPAKLARTREALLAKYIFFNHPYFAASRQNIIELYEDEHFFLLSDAEREQKIVTLEGGDVMMVAPNHLLIGVSERTSPYAVNQVIARLFDRNVVEKVSVIRIPPKREFMHIDTVFTQVARDTWVLFGGLGRDADTEEQYLIRTMLDEPLEEPLAIHQFTKGRREPKEFPYLEDLLEDVSRKDLGVTGEVKLIYSGDGEYPYDEREQWTDSCNLLVVQEGVAIAYDRNDRTMDAFRKAGYETVRAADLLEAFELGKRNPQDMTKTIILLPSAELSRARGGSHCMSMPLLRDRLV
ncbi:MAG: amidinotransferase [Bacteroidetes bacterium]|nr:amidinotransferase [Bacteroidota bacterium]